jgi:hypothetical protein
LGDGKVQVCCGVTDEPGDVLGFGIQLWGGVGGGEFALNIGPGRRDEATLDHPQGGGRRVGVGDGATDLAGVGVEPVIRRGDAVGHQHAVHDDAVAVHRGAYGAQHGQRVVVVAGLGDRDQYRAGKPLGVEARIWPGTVGPFDHRR